MTGLSKEHTLGMRFETIKLKEAKVNNNKKIINNGFVFCTVENDNLCFYNVKDIHDPYVENFKSIKVS